MKRLTHTSLFGVLALGLVAAYPLATANTRPERSDCPGKVVCRLTGEEICRDHSPLAAKAGNTDPTRADCPGQIECPLTGELVCRDRCPAITGKPANPTVVASEKETVLPPCCRAKK